MVGPAVDMIRSFLNWNASSVPDLDTSNSSGMNVIQRDLWTQYTCKVRNGWIPSGTVSVRSILYPSFLFFLLLVVLVYWWFSWVWLSWYANDFSIARPVVTRSSGEHTSGNNTSRAVAIANECLGLKSLKDFSQWSSSSRLNIETAVRDLQFSF